MFTLRFILDHNQQQPKVIPDALFYDNNEHRVPCGLCKRKFNVDDEGYRFYLDEVNSSGKNPLVCPICNNWEEDVGDEV